MAQSKALKVFEVQYTHKGCIGEFNQLWDTACYSHLSVQIKNRLARLVRTAVRVIGEKEHQSIQSIYLHSALRGAHKIFAEPSYVLHSEYELLPSGRRLRVPKC